MFAQHVFNASQVWILYAITACGFYLATTSCRHFNFAAGAPFLLMPQLIAARQFLPWPIAFLGSLLLCTILGIAWRKLSAYLFRRGSREGQLLIISLAALGITENTIRLIFGNESLALWPFKDNDLIVFRWLLVSRQQLVLGVAGAMILAALLILWHRSLLGIAMRGLLESRYNLLLRGYDVPLLESIGAAAGFSLVGIAGTLWAATVPVRPGMGLEIGVVGIVTYIVGPKIAGGLQGLVLASLAVAVLRLLLALNFEGDWNMTAMLAVLGLGIAFTGAKSLLETRSSRL